MISHCSLSIRSQDMWLTLGALLCLSWTSGSFAGRLAVNGTHFVKDGHRVFLSGTNQAWVHFGYDFGNNRFQAVRSQFAKVLTELAAAGGNSIRVWVHIGGQTSPQFDASGHVTGTDSQGTLIHDLRQYLHDARQHGILVFFTLWSGASIAKVHPDRLDGLLRDPNKLQSYIDHALVPMVTALHAEPALGGWDLMNEPEGILKSGLHSATPCQDTTKMAGKGGWGGKTYPPFEIQRFLNRQADAIRRADPRALVTVGSASNYAATDKFGFRNLWKDACLVAAGGKHNGVLSFYQYHTYARHGHWSGHSPMQHDFSDFGLDKPLVVGEFRESNGAGMTIQQMFHHAYYHGYSGAWSWQAIEDNWTNEKLGIASIKNLHGANGGRVNFTL